MKQTIRLMIVCALAITSSAWAQGKTFKPDDEGFIRNWLVLEAITLDDNASNHSEDAQKEFFDKEHFKGQFSATPKEGEKVKVDGETHAWEAKEADDFFIGFEGDNSLFLGVAYIITDKDIAGVSLAIGSDDSSAWRLNGKEVLRVFSGRGVDRDQDRTENPVTLKAGLNVLTFAVINGGGPAGAAARFLDKSDNPITNIKISLTPPATDGK